jgi:O-antigen/teichoic acid export membrane protein
MGGAAMTGYYSVASRVISAASVPLVTYVLAIAPRLFRAGETGVAAGWRSAWRLLLPILAYGALAGVGMFFLAALLPLLLGKDFSASVPIVRALATLPLLTGISNLLLAVLTCSGAQRVRILLETCSLGVNIALNVVLIPVLGALGAVASILASQMTLAGMAAAAIFYLSRRGIE